MKILQINTTDMHGGAAKISRQLGEELKGRGHDVHMFVKLKYSDDPNVFVAKWPNPISRLLKKITGKDIGSSISNKIRPLLSNDIDFFRSDNILETKEFKEADIIHCHNLHGNYFKLETLAKMTELKPVVWTLHDVWPITPHCARIYSDREENGFFQCEGLNEYQSLSWNNEDYLKKRKKRIYDRLKNLHLVVPSDWLLEKVGRSVLKDKPISRIYNGIDTKIFKPRDKKSARAELNLPENKKIILFLSPIGADNGKGWDYLQKIIEKYAGNDSALFVCIATVKIAQQKIPKNVRYLDYIENEEQIALYFGAADVFLYPSLAESFGLVAAESLASGTPAVIFNAGGLPEIIAHGENGYVAKYGDENDLMQGIERILNLSETEIAEMSLRSRKKAESLFDINTMAETYLSLYNNVIKKR